MSFRKLSSIMSSPPGGMTPQLDLCSQKASPHCLTCNSTGRFLEYRVSRKATSHRKIVREQGELWTFYKTNTAEAASRSETTSTPIDRLTGQENIPHVFFCSKKE